MDQLAGEEPQVNGSKGVERSIFSDMIFINIINEFIFSNYGMHVTCREPLRAILL